MIKEEYLNELKEKLKSIDFGNNLIFLNSPITFLNDLDLEIIQELEEFDIKNKKYKSSIFDKNVSNLFLTKKQTQDLNDFALNNNLKTNEIKLNTSKSSNLEFIKNTPEPVVSRDVQVDTKETKETKETVPNLEFVRNTSEPVVSQDIQVETKETKDTRDTKETKETKETVPNLEFVRNTSEPVVSRDIQVETKETKDTRDTKETKETKETVPNLEFVRNTSEPVVSRDIQVETKETKETVPNLEFVRNTSEPVVSQDIQVETKETKDTRDTKETKETKETVPNLEFVRNTSEPVVSRDIQVETKETKETVPNLEFVRNTSEPVVSQDIQVETKETKDTRDTKETKETKETVPNLEFVRNTSEPVVSRDIQVETKETKDTRDTKETKETKETVPNLEFVRNTSEKDDQNLNNFSFTDLSFTNPMQDTSSYYLSKEEMKSIKDDISRNYKKNNISTNILFDIKNRRIPTFKRGGSVNLNNSQGIKTVLVGEKNSPESFKFNKDSVNINPNGLIQSPTIATFVNPDVKKMNSLKVEKINQTYNEKSNIKKEIKEFFNLDSNITLFDLNARFKKISNKKSNIKIKNINVPLSSSYPHNIVKKSKNSCLIYNKLFDVK